MSFSLPNNWYNDMWFGRNSSDKDDLYYLEKLQEAEAKGLKQVTFEARNRTDKKMVNQIFHYIIQEKKKVRRDDDGEERAKVKFHNEIVEKGGLKYHWKCVEVGDNVLTEDSGKPSILNYNSEKISDFGKVTLVRLEGDYHKEVNHEILLNEFNDILDKEFGGHMKEKRYVITVDSDSYIGQVVKIYIKKNVNWDLTRKDDVNNPHNREIYDEEIMIEVKTETDDRIHHDKIKLKTTEHVNIEKFKKKYVLIDEDDISQFLDKIALAEAKGSLEVFEDKLTLGDGSSETEKAQAAEIQNALVGFSSKEHLEVVHKSLAFQTTRALSVSHAFKRSIAMESDRVEHKVAIMRQQLDSTLAVKKAQLEAMREKLYGVIEVFERQMKKIFRLITTLEIYLGVHEDVIQIAEGTPAPETDPICFRQQKLYMDMEFGDPMLTGYNERGKKDKYKQNNDGMDTDDLEIFEKWLIESKHYQKLVPESKCVVVMQPRFSEKIYVSDSWENFLINVHMGNQELYILIRNGDNIYRIKSGKIKYGTRLFPLRDELQGMFDKLTKLSEDKDNAKWDSDKERVDKQVEELEDNFFQYRRNMLLLQGLVWRTEIFAPVPLGLNILDINTHKNEDGSDRVTFIYDDEDNKLGNGKPLFAEWQKETNKTIKKGSRIFLSSPSGSSNSWSDRFTIYWRGKNDSDARHLNSGPPMPPSGIYEVREYTEKIPTYKSEWITMKKWSDEGFKKKEAELKGNDYIPKYEKAYRGLYSTRTEQRNGVEHIEVFVLDEKGQKTSTMEMKTTLRISYNPKDEVYRDWYKDSGERKTNLTFIIEPDDDFIIHYDACLLDDIYYYIDSRLDRKRYVSMMPVLWGIRDSLIVDAKKENELADAMAFEISTKHNVEQTLAREIIQGSIEWYKNDVVKVWKRGISEHDPKSWRMIKEESLKRLKRSGQQVNYNFDNKNNVLLFKHPWGDTFLCFGLTKAEFIKTIRPLTKQSRGRYPSQTIEIGKKKLVDSVTIATDEDFLKLARANKLKVVHIQRVDSVKKNIIIVTPEL